MFAKLWNDERGSVALEYLLLLSVVGLGLVVAFSNLGNALTSEYTELGNSLLGLSQAYAFSAESGCKSFRGGSNVFDTPQTIRFFVTTVFPISIDVNACSGAP